MWAPMSTSWPSFKCLVGFECDATCFHFNSEVFIVRFTTRFNSDVVFTVMVDFDPADGNDDYKLLCSHLNVNELIHMGIMRICGHFSDLRLCRNPYAIIVRTLDGSVVTGAQADDSIVLQFLLDWREKNALKTDYEKQDKSYFKFQNKDSRSTEENVSFLLTISQQIANSTRKNETEQIWVSHFLFIFSDQNKISMSGL